MGREPCQIVTPAEQYLFIPHKSSSKARAFLRLVVASDGPASRIGHPQNPEQFRNAPERNRTPELLPTEVSQVVTLCDSLGGC